MAIKDSLDEMPFCIYDILHARMLLNVEQDLVQRDDRKLRAGVPVERLTHKMNEISKKIRAKKEKEYDGYESED